MRQDANDTFGARAAEWVRSTDQEGRAPESRPIDYDIRFSNICNFKCRTCWLGASSSWHADHAAIYGGPKPRKAILRSFKTPSKFWAAFDGFIDDVEKLYFAGGEPLLQEEHYQVLEALHERKRYDVLIHYNTNFSVLKYRGTDVLKVWQPFRRLHVSASLDASGARGELLRHGQSWPTVLSHRERLRSECAHVNFKVACSVSVFNVWHVPDFHRELVDTGVIAPGEFDLNIVQHPAHLSAQILPLQCKRVVETRLVNHIAWLRGLGEEAVATQFEALLKYVFDGEREELIPSFLRFCTKLDELRGEKTFQVFPELSPLRLKEA